MAKKARDLTCADWKALYPKFTMAQLAELFSCGETTIFKYLKRCDIQSTKKHRKARSDDHKRRLSEAHTGKTRTKTGKNCSACGKSFYVIPARFETAKYCSYKCRAVMVQKEWTGDKHPSYIAEAVRKKACEGCGQTFFHTPPKPITSFLLQKFCTKTCADKHGLHYRGDDNPLFKGDAARRRSRSGLMSRWATKVIERDGFKCMRCKVSGKVATLQAHHIRPYEFYPELRNDLANGISLCSECHWTVHTTLEGDYIVLPDDKKVPAKLKELLVVGAITRTKMFGKDARKWTGHCYWCGTAIVKRLSDVTGKRAVFCSPSCSAKHQRAFGKYRPTSAEMVPATARPPSELL